MDNTQGAGTGLPQATGYEQTTRFSPFRLVLIPLLIYIVWVLDTFLLEGSIGVFSRYQPGFLIVYSIIANILIGTLIPVFCLKSAFLSGAVNMFQIGFRSLRRTLLAVIVTACTGYLLLVTFTPFGSQRAALIGITVLLLPVAIASVMVCWVLIGTHLQAYIRSYGAIVSVITGVLATSVLFGLSFAAHSPPLTRPGMLIPFLGIGFASALFFFSVRDIYASAVFIALALAPVLQGRVDPFYTSQFSPVVAWTAALSLVALAGCQWYLSKKFITVRLPIKAEKDPGA